MMNKPIRLAVVGAAGRMGKAIIGCASRSDHFQLTAAVEAEGHPDLGADAGTAAGIGECGVIMTDDSAAVSNADVIVDFSLRNATSANIARASALKKPMVIGTTGLGDEETEALKVAAGHIAIVHAPNMSLGINLLFAVVTKAASVLNPDYAAEIDETHHVHKKDAPSGTALRLGEKLAQGRNQDLKTAMVHNPDNPDDPALKSRIVIRSHREGEVVGDHTVSFENEGERVEFTHKLRSRDALALGALHAAEWVVDQPTGLYDMQDVLGL
jgi:4-hydroxy-tetrahydrodipicolinate reductase